MTNNLQHLLQKHNICTKAQTFKKQVLTHINHVKFPDPNFLFSVNKMTNAT